MWHRFATGVLADRLPGAVGVEVGGGGAGEGGLEGGVVVQVQVNVVVEVEDAATDVQPAVGEVISGKAALEVLMVHVPVAVVVALVVNRNQQPTPRAKIRVDTPLRKRRHMTKRP